MWFYFFFFFKQKTAYEMRISDWSSDVCSSDLVCGPVATCGSTSSVAAALVDLVAFDVPLAAALGGSGFVAAALSVAGADFSGAWVRSEEHTSELQSLMRISYAVFCLKKKKK